MASNEGEGAPDAQEGLMFHQKMKLSFDPAAPPPPGNPTSPQALTGPAYYR